MWPILIQDRQDQTSYSMSAVNDTLNENLVHSEPEANPLPQETPNEVHPRLLRFMTQSVSSVLE